MCSGLFHTLSLFCLFSLWKTQLENATALFVVEVYCSGAKSKVVLRSEFSNAAEWTRYGFCFAQQKTDVWMKKKKIVIGVTDTFGRVSGAQFYVPLWRTARLKCSGAPNDNFRKIICSEDDLRSRIFGSFSDKFLACLPLLEFSNFQKIV